MGRPAFVNGIRPKGVVPTRLVVVGTRTFNQPARMWEILDRFVFWWDDVFLITGANYSDWNGEHFQRSWVHGQGSQYTGADYHAWKWAEHNWYERQTVCAEWKRYGKSAGPRRNREMLKVAGPNCFLVAFWDGRSPGTADCLRAFDSVLDSNRIRVVRYDKWRKKKSGS